MDADYVLAAWMIILAGIFDTLDGIMARITKSSSSFGVEFDSLSDVVSFGVAPSFLVYNIALHTQETLGLLISAMPMIMGALRLARFNIQLVGFDKDFFKGLPIPSMAITISSYILTYHDKLSDLRGFETLLLPPMITVLSLLMISNLKYDTAPKFSRKGIKQHPMRFTIGIVGICAIVFSKGQAIFPFFVFYVMTGPLRYIINLIKKSFSSVTEKEEETEITSYDI